MKSLPKRDIELIRIFEKESDTTKPKEIWLRGWEEMRYYHFRIRANGDLNESK